MREFFGDVRIRSMEVEWTLKTKNRVKLSSDAAHGAQDKDQFVQMVANG